MFCLIIVCLWICSRSFLILKLFTFQRSRSSSQSSGSLSQTSAEVRSYFNHTQDQPPYPFQGLSDQQYTQQQYQYQQQQQQQTPQVGQSQLANPYNQLKRTSTTQQRGQTQQKLLPLQNPGQHNEEVTKTNS